MTREVEAPAAPSRAPLALDNRFGYVMLDLNRRQPDIRRYVCDLEEWIIQTLDRFNVKGERRDGRVGIWVDRGGGREDKIAAIGVRIRRWVTFHGIAINVDPDLEHFSGIVSCGIGDQGVTSLADLGIDADMAALDAALAQTVPAFILGQAVGRDSNPSGTAPA